MSECKEILVLKKQHFARIRFLEATQVVSGSRTKSNACTRIFKFERLYYTSYKQTEFSNEEVQIIIM